jgi:hypothetical protein
MTRPCNLSRTFGLVRCEEHISQRAFVHQVCSYPTAFFGFRWFTNGFKSSVCIRGCAAALSALDTISGRLVAKGVLQPPI